MKNKKIISLVAALAMIFSMFSAFTVANAEGKGIALAGSLSADGTKMTIDASVVEPEGGLKAFTVKFNVPDGVTNDTIKFTSNDATVVMTTNVVNGVAAASWAGSSPVTFKDNKLFTAEITLAAPLAVDYDVTLQKDSSMKDTVGEIFCPDDMAAVTTTVKKWQDPNKKPDTVARPTPNTDPDDTPDVPEPILPTGKGLALNATIDKTNTVITLDASVAQPEGGLKAFTVKFNVPDGVTNDTIKFTSNDATVVMTTNVVNGVAAASWAGSSPVTFNDNKLFTAEITLPSPLTEALELKLQKDSSMKDTVGEIFCPDDMIATSAVVTPSGSEVKPTKTANLKDYVGKGYAEAVAAAKAAGNEVYLTVDVKKADGTAAVYGTDFDAEYPVGTKLTKKEYENLIHGYTSNDMSDVISKLKFNIYNNNVKTISTTLNATNTESQLVDPVTDKTIGGSTKPTPAPKAPKLNVSMKPSTATVGTKVTVTATVANPKDDGELTVTVDEDSLDYVTGSGIKSTVADDNKSATTTFTGAVAKTNAVVLNYTYTYTDENGEEKTVTAEKKISIKEKSTSTGGNGSGNNSSDSNGSGNGPIAGPSDVVVPGTGTAMFTDLGDVVWAQPAIYALAAKNVIQGRDEYTFDPNANITRAEYCQILIGAIDKTSEYADSSFADVPTDAWYYHSVAVASKYGIVSGYGDGNFGPYDLITRQDMALMTLKAAQVMNTNLAAVNNASFTDADQISDYANEAVYTLANAGIINGMGDGTFAPLANATRAQAAVIIYSAFN